MNLDQNDGNRRRMLSIFYQLGNELRPELSYLCYGENMDFIS